jgi:hypothetical protein
LAGLGFTSSLTPSITTVIQQYYPTVRKVVCLKECVTQRSVSCNRRLNFFFSVAIPIALLKPLLTSKILLAR